MDGDPKHLEQMVKSGEKPHHMEVLAEVYFTSLARAEEAEDEAEKSEYLKMARKARKDLSKAGLKPIIHKGKVELTDGA